MPLEVIGVGVFLTGYSVYAYFKIHRIKNNSKKKKIVYYKVTDKVKRVKKLNHIVNESVGGKKGDTFFK
ncbi:MULTISPECIES: hypothetical protein [unclassified Clostridium]|uniref:hypothetical protein n=1 Tax=unclassified Clostridium TaxID=2614128 RepID=UPI0025B89329|nr:MULTISPECIES: hypothetical protein [unclassified Clostridium]